MAVRTIVLSHNGGGGGERGTAYDDCSSPALNAAGKGANFTSTCSSPTLFYCSMS